MTILLDIDGVLVTTPSWQPTEQLSDGFMKFNQAAVENLAIVYKETNASIVLTTTHRINFDEAKWKDIFRTRGLNFQTITKLNNKTKIDQLADRATEIREWVEQNGQKENYVIIDDDSSLNGLTDDIKERWVSTKQLIGFDKDAKVKTLNILTSNSKFPCPCCGHKTFNEKRTGTYDICPVCFWEDDPFQFENPDYESGANPTSLRQAQKNFIIFGACDETMKRNVRQPNADEPKDKYWRPYK
jgi:rubrerythrin